MKHEKIFLNKEKSKILARIVAHLMGDGCVTHKYLRYNNKDKLLLKNFKNYLSKLFLNLHFIRGKVNSGTSFIQIQNKDLISFLFKLVNDFRSENLEFPRFIRTKSMKREFISAVFDDEGCVGLRTFKKTGEIKRNLEIASKSKKFMEEIKLILEREFDVKSNKIISFKKNINEKEFVTFKLSITGKENFINFDKEIGFTHPQKNVMLKEMISSYIRK